MKVLLTKAARSPNAQTTRSKHLLNLLDMLQEIQCLLLYISLFLLFSRGKKACTFPSLVMSSAHEFFLQLYIHHRLSSLRVKRFLLFRIFLLWLLQEGNGRQTKIYSKSVVFFIFSYVNFNHNPFKMELSSEMYF